MVLSSASATLTDDRVEQKFRVEPGRSPALLTQLAANLQEHHFTGKGSNPLPRARHYVTTVYFDTPDRTLYRAVQDDESSLKIRAREYYDLHPELLELATSANDILRYQPVLWIELKRKTGGRTQKRRVGIPKQDVTRFFEHGEVSAAMRELQSKEAAAGDDVIGELLKIRTSFEQALAPSCVVNYRRIAFQNHDATLRVTLDQRLCCFAPRADLLSLPSALSRETLGAPTYQEPSHILEIKARAGTPTWLVAALHAAHGDPRPFSKFATASRAVHGDLE